jgi:hypothetical protein
VIFQDHIEPNTEWQFLLSGSPNQDHAVSAVEFASPSSSLAITSSGAGDGDMWSYWTFSFNPVDIPEGTPVDVKVKIKTGASPEAGRWSRFVEM